MEAGLYVCVSRSSMSFLFFHHLFRSDYRGLKKRIAAIRREQEGKSMPEHSSGDDPLLSPVNEDNESAASPVEGADNDDADAEDEESEGEKLNKKPHVPMESPSAEVTVTAEQRQLPGATMSSASQPGLVEGGAHPRLNVRSQSLRMFASRFRLPSFSSAAPVSSDAHPRLVHSATFMDVRPDQDSASAHDSRHFHPTFNGENGNMQTPHRSLREILLTLTPTQKKFFDKLDIELDKIESFYLDREKEARERSEALKSQLNELRDHRRVFYVGGLPRFCCTVTLTRTSMLGSASSVQ
jgi:hypothetical protein